MGSSGNGMFGTYRGGGAGSIVRGGNNGGDECPLAIENILLEDVAISEYFQNHKDVPSTGQAVELSSSIVIRDSRFVNEFHILKATCKFCTRLSTFVMTFPFFPLLL